MRLKSLELTNFRSYKEQVTIPDLSTINCLVGPNASGKSTVIEALKTLKRLLLGQTTSFEEIIYDRKNLDAKISIVIKTDNNIREALIRTIFNEQIQTRVLNSPFLNTLNYSITFGPNNVKQEQLFTPNLESGHVCIFERTINAQNNFIISSTRLENDSNNLGFANLNQTSIHRVMVGSVPPNNILSNTSLDKYGSQLVSFVKGFILAFEWFDANRHITPRMESGEEPVLNSTGNNLTKFMNNLLVSNPRSFVGLSDGVREIIPSIQEILSPFKDRMATLQMREKGLTTPTEVNNASSGLTEILVLAVGIITKQPGSVILIEEPESHLHASAQRALFELIRQLSLDKQFILTTHSTIFTDYSNDVHTYLISKNNGVSSIVPVKSSRELKIAKDILGYRNTDLFGDSMVVFIEGDSEEVAFPIIADALGIDLCRKGVRLVNIKGNGKVAKMEEYLRYLKDTGVKSYVVADGNKRVKEKLQDWERTGLLEPNSWTVWDLELEDCFSLDMLTEALNSILIDQKVGFKISSEQLTVGKKAGVTIVRVIEKILYENGCYLDKPALSERMSLILANDLKSKEHKQIPPEIELMKIAQTSAKASTE